MKTLSKLVLGVLGSLLLTTLVGCGTSRMITPYDEVIDNGLRDYREAINLLVKDVSAHAGTTEGTFDANTDRYRALEVKADTLRERAKLHGSTKGCKLGAAVTQKLLALLGDAVPAEVRPEGQLESGNAFGCTERLLTIVRTQLTTLETIHRDTDKCPAPPDNRPVSCLREATAQDALNITNQSIDAAWIVETAKREGEGD